MNLEKVKVVFCLPGVIRLCLQSTLVLLGGLKVKWQICGKAAQEGIYLWGGLIWKVKWQICGKAAQKGMYLWQGFIWRGVLMSTTVKEVKVA